MGHSMVVVGVEPTCAKMAKLPTLTLGHLLEVGRLSLPRWCLRHVDLY